MQFSCFRRRRNVKLGVKIVFIFAILIFVTGFFPFQEKIIGKKVCVSRADAPLRTDAGRPAAASRQPPAGSPERLGGKMISGEENRPEKRAIGLPDNRSRQEQEMTKRTRRHDGIAVYRWQNWAGRERS
jgi:hypothetical protein